MTMPGRNYNAGTGYRYGFNGKENDKDISEGGQDCGIRIFFDTTSFYNVAARLIMLMKILICNYIFSFLAGSNKYKILQLFVVLLFYNYFINYSVKNNFLYKCCFTD